MIANVYVGLRGELCKKCISLSLIYANIINRFNICKHFKQNFTPYAFFYEIIEPLC